LFLRGQGAGTLTRLTIERKEKVSPEEFRRDHLRGIGKPVIVTDAMGDWPARSKWTFEYFRETYGTDLGTAPLELNSQVAKVTRVSAYLDHLNAPSEDLPGFWIETKTGKPLRPQPSSSGAPPYLLGWSAFKKHPEIYNDIKPAPYFVSDLTLALTPTMRDIFEWTYEQEYWSVYVGPKGSLSKLHHDFASTHAYLAQIAGRKKAILFSPDDGQYLYGGDVDLESPDFERFPMFDQATAFECVIEPGEMLFIPSGWWHHVRALENSITVSHNFFNETNISEHMAGIFDRVPRLQEGLEKFPEWRAQLGGN
jgi:hypothetical protein